MNSVERFPSRELYERLSKEYADKSLKIDEFDLKLKDFHAKFNARNDELNTGVVAFTLDDLCSESNVLQAGISELEQQILLVKEIYESFQMGLVEMDKFKTPPDYHEQFSFLSSQLAQEAVQLNKEHLVNKTQIRTIYEKISEVYSRAQTILNKIHHSMLQFEQRISDLRQEKPSSYLKNRLIRNAPTAVLGLFGIQLPQIAPHKLPSTTNSNGSPPMVPLSLSAPATPSINATIPPAVPSSASLPNQTSILTSPNGHPDNTTSASSSINCQQPSPSGRSIFSARLASPPDDSPDPENFEMVESKKPSTTTPAGSNSTSGGAKSKSKTKKSNNG